MSMIAEPSIPAKIQKMKERVRWKHPKMISSGIDQTSMVIDDGKEDNPEFSFMVIGDSGTKPHYGHHPQRKVAELMGSWQLLVIQVGEGTRQRAEGRRKKDIIERLQTSLHQTFEE